MENRNKRATYLLEEIITEILARLPLRSISRFKSVCKTWKSILESLYFRRLFLSLHQNKSRSWSLAYWSPKQFLIDFHGCQTWGLPKSLGYYFRNLFQTTHKYNYMDSSDGLILIKKHNTAYYVGNPILKQWVTIPIPTPNNWKAHLVTLVDEDGVVLSFKVVLSRGIIVNKDRSSTCLPLFVYSSVTGNWTHKELHCPHYLTFSDFRCRLITLHGMLYHEFKKVIVAHDFSGESNVCQVIPLPDHDSNNDLSFRRTLTTSTDFVIYIKKLDNKVLKIWRLVNGAWELMWNTSLTKPSDDYELLTMNPFNLNIVYLWSHKNKCLASCNIETQSYHIFTNQDGDLRNCFINHSLCEKHIDGLCVLYLQGRCRKSFNRFEYVLPRWIGSIPCPPQTEVFDTTSLLARNRIRREN